MAVKKFQGSRPGSLVGRLPIAFFGGVHKSMGGIGIGIELVRFIEFCEFRVKLAHVFGRRVFVILTEMAKDRTMNFGSALEGRRRIPAPSAEDVAAVVGDCGFDKRTCRGCQIGDPSAHAKSDNAEVITVNSRMTL